MADDAAPKMHVDWIRLFNDWRNQLQQPIEINVEQIIGGGQALTRVNDTNVIGTLTGTPATALLKPVTITFGWAGVLSVTRGGTGLSSVATGDLLYGSAADVLSRRAIGSAADVLTVSGGLPVWAAPAAASTVTITNDTTTNASMFPTWVTANTGNLPLKVTSTKLSFNPSTGILSLATALPATSGGTGFGSYAVGDLLYADTTTSLAKLADVSAGSYLRSGGVTTAPVWSTLTLPNAATTGDLLYASAANTLIVRAIGSAADVLTVSGGLPVWAAPAAAATSVIVNDVTTNATMFPVWVTANTGSLPLKVSSTKLSWNPSTNRLAIGPVAAAFSLDVSTGTDTTARFWDQTAVTGATKVVLRAGASGTHTLWELQNNAGTGIGRYLSDGRYLDAVGITGVANFVLRSGSTLFLDGGSGSDVQIRPNTTVAVTIASAGGRVGVGVATPLANVHIKAGTATASTAPLKFTSGALLTTAEAGAVEFLTDAFYGTITTGAARKTFAFLEAPALTTWSSSGKLTNYNSINTAGWGIPAIYGSGRSIAQVAAVASVATYTLGAADGSFLVSANVNVTTSTLHNFTVAVDYTDETNTAQTLTLTFSQLAGVFVTAITQVTGAGPYEGIPLQIRCKASTAITVKTVGTFTTLVYNVEGTIQQVS